MQADFSQKTCIAGILFLALGACSDNGQNGAAGIAGSEKKQSKTVSMASPPASPESTSVTELPMEKRRKDVRVIAGGSVAVPKVEGELIARLPDASVPAPATRPPPKLPEKPRGFSLPLVTSAGSFVSDDTEVQIAGVDAPDASAECEGAEGKWPCGNFAKAALQRLVRTNTITCIAREGTSEDRWVGQCRTGKFDLAEWLVSNGWAKAASDELKPAEEAARKANRGIWQKR